MQMLKSKLINMMIDRAFAKVNEIPENQKVLAKLVHGETRGIVFSILDGSKLSGKEVDVDMIKRSELDVLYVFCIETSKEGVIRRVDKEEDLKNKVLSCYLIEDVFLDLIRQKYTPYYAFTRGWLWFGDNDKWLAHVPVLNQIFRFLYDFYTKNLYDLKI